MVTLGLLIERLNAPLDPDDEFGFKLIRMKEGWVASIWNNDSLSFSACGWGATPDEAIESMEREVACEGRDEDPEWVERAIYF